MVVGLFVSCFVMLCRVVVGRWNWCSVWVSVGLLEVGGVLGMVRCVVWWLVSCDSFVGFMVFSSRIGCSRCVSRVRLC